MYNKAQKVVGRAPVSKDGELTMTLRHLKIFIAVCDTGSMTAAAKELFIAQPAVSFAIAEMENYYGHKVFNRVSNRLYITEVGKVLLRHARQIAAQFDDMEAEVRNWNSEEILRVGSSVSVSSAFLPGRIKAFQGEHPGVTVQVSVKNSAEIEQMVVNDQLDMALIDGPIINRLIACHKVGASGMVFICPPEHPWSGGTIEMSDLNNCSFIVRERESMERRLLEKLFQHNKIKVNVVWQSISIDAILNAVASGLGVAAVSGVFAEERLRAGAVGQFHVRGVRLSRESFIIYQQNKALDDLEQDFLRLCVGPFHPLP